MLELNPCTHRSTGRRDVHRGKLGRSAGQSQCDEKYSEGMYAGSNSEVDGDRLRVGLGYDMILHVTFTTNRPVQILADAINLLLAEASLPK